MEKSAEMKSLMNPLSWSFRTYYFLGAIGCFGAIAYALYVQYHMLMQPCPLCILQRVAFIAAGVFFLIGALHNPKSRAWRRIHASLVSLSALGGLLIAGRHVAIQLAPSDPRAFCGGMDLGYIIDAMPLRDALTTVFKGSGECAKIDWSFLGFSMPMWTLVLYIGVIALAVYPAIRKS
jgi:disulfide bond formation protein DsbB